MTRTHRPRRPAWTCQGCSRAWPCPPALHLLAAQLPRISLCMYLASAFMDAMRDRPDLPPAELYQRFLIPARRPTLAPR